MSLTQILSSKMVAAVIAVVMITGGFFAFATPHAKALTLAELVELFIALEVIPADKAAQARSVVTQQTPTTPSAGTSAVCPFTWTRNLNVGATGNDVMKLQQFLNDNGFTIAASGAGSAGNETSYYGSLTGVAVKAFQEANASSVLTPVGLTTGTMFFGPSSRAYANSMCTTTTTTPTTPGTTPVGTGLSVMAGTQPANSLFVENASRVAFTRFTVSAGSDGAVTMNSVSVRKVGLINRAVFDGVVLLDQDGHQLGTSRTLNANNEVTVGTAVTIPAGQTRTFTIAANAPASLGGNAGEVGGLQVTGVNTSATVSGSLPINGAQHTVNATLSIGTATMDVSSFDPNTSRDREVGTTGYTFSGVRVTAGSAEDIRLRSIRWNQIGSVASGDLANVVVVVDGTQYPTTASADGKYFTASFGNGILIQKGFSVDAYLKADVVGGNAAGRTARFDIDEKNDIHITGETFGYGVLAAAGSTSTASNSNSQFTTGTPFFSGSLLTITGGSATTISRSSDVPAQNVAINVPNQPLGGFVADIKGEALTVQQMTFNVTLTDAAGPAPTVAGLTNVTLVNQNGAVVAGPVDGVGAALTGTITFTDSVTLPVGMNTYTLKGRVGTDFANGDTIIAATDPSTNWTNVKGDITGNTIVLSQTPFNMNTMTVRAASLGVSLSASPAAQGVVPGKQGHTFANYQFDANASGEDVRFSTVTAVLAVTGSAAANQLTSCQLFDGSTALNTGSNVVNPTAAGNNTFTLDSQFVVPKGSVKTLEMRCNVSANATTGTFAWGIPAGMVNPTGVTSSQIVTPTVTTATGPIMTLGAGTIAVTKDSSSPASMIAAGGSTDVTLGVLRLRASNETMNLEELGLVLTSGTAASLNYDGTSGQVGLYHGGTKVGTAVFTGSTATVNNISSVSLPANQDVQLTVKTDLAAIGTSQPGVQGALIQVNWSGSLRATGAATLIVTGGTVTAVDGVYVYRSFPTFASHTLSSTAIAAGSTNELYRFSVTANNSGSGISMNEVAVNLATSSATTTDLKVFAYTDSNFSNPVAGFTDGQVVATIASPVSGANAAVFTPAPLEIPAGVTYYFKVEGDVEVTATSGTSQVSTRILGDAAFAALGTAAGVAGNFIWSPNYAGASAVGDTDWTNGFRVSGLSSSGSNLVTISKTN